MEQENPYLASQVLLTERGPARSLLVPPAELRTVASGLWYLAAAMSCLLFVSCCWGSLQVASIMSRPTAMIQVHVMLPESLSKNKAGPDNLLIGISAFFGLMYLASPIMHLLGLVRLCRAPRELQLRSLALASCLLFLGALALASGSALLQLWLHKQPWLGTTLAILGIICGIIALVTLTLLLERLARSLQNPIAMLLSSSLWRLTMVSLVCAGVFVLAAPVAAAKQNAAVGEPSVWLLRLSIFSLVVSAALAGYCAVLYLITVCSLRRVVRMQLASIGHVVDKEPSAAAPLPLATTVLPKDAAVIADGLQMLLWGVRSVVAAALLAVWLSLQQADAPGTKAVFGLLAALLALASLFMLVRALVLFCQTPREFQATKSAAIACWALGIWGLLLGLGLPVVKPEYVKIPVALSAISAVIYQAAFVIYLRRVAISVGDGVATALSVWLRNVFVFNLLVGGALTYYAAQLDYAATAVSPVVSPVVTPSFVVLPLAVVLAGLLWLFVSAVFFVLFVATVRGLRSIILSKLEAH